jgi:diamine N-acetyltransferase
MIGMQFRSATPHDAAAIADFMTRNFLATFGHSASPENVQKAVHDYYAIDAQHADLADHTIVNCLCILEQKIAGLAQIKPPKANDHPQDFELSRFYVDAAYHGKGIAPELMKNVIAAVKQKSAQSLWLSVWQEAAQAIRFYQKQGFMISGDTIFMIGDEAMKDWIMRKDLSQNS